MIPFHYKLGVICMVLVVLPISNNNIVITEFIAAVWEHGDITKWDGVVTD